MARESNWYAAVFAVLAGVFLGATLARQRGREMPGDSPLVLVPVDGPGPGMNADSEDAVPAAIEPLSAKVLKTRVVEIFPVGYLTLMAIIQGAAYAALFITIQQDGLLAHGWTLHAWLALVQSLATGLTVVIVTHEYLLLTVVVRWVPTVFDTLIPYLLGFGEIWMAVATGQRTSWWTALASLCAVAVFAFWHTRTRTVPGAFGDKPGLYQRQRRYITNQIVSCCVMLLISIAAALLNSYRVCPDPLNIGMTSVVTLVGVCIMILGTRYQNELYDEYRVPRWRWTHWSHRPTGSVQNCKRPPKG